MFNLLAQNSPDLDAAAGAAMGALAVIAIVYLALVIVWIAGMWKAFEKAGKPGWAAIVPIYNIIIWLELANKPVWWIILILLIPFVNLIVLIITLNGVAKSFGRGVGTTIGLVILPFIFWPVLGFGSAQYQGGAQQPAA